MTPGSWCILRTSGPKTLPLTRSLASAGFDVWTPVAVTRPRVRGKRSRPEVEAPITPTFVFAKAHHLPDLVREIGAARRNHPSFSIFQWDGRIPLIAERDIAGLRDEEAAAAKSAADRRRAEEGQANRDAKDALRRAMPIGEEFVMPSGPFAGMTGVVESSTRKTAWVTFGGMMRVQVDTWLLAADAVGTAKPCCWGTTA